MVNRHRGEIEAVLDGKSYRLCLTLGALAELEHAFGEDDMLAVAERFEAGRIAARDAIRMIGAGLRWLRPRRRGGGFYAERGRRRALRRYRGAAAGCDLRGGTARGGERPFCRQDHGRIKQDGSRPDLFPWDAAVAAARPSAATAAPVAPAATASSAS
jgi:Phage tail tube protein, GTA-gp10